MFYTEIAEGVDVKTLCADLISLCAAHCCLFLKTCPFKSLPCEQEKWFYISTSLLKVTSKAEQYNVLWYKFSEKQSQI